MSYLLRLFEMIAQFLASDSIESMTSALLHDGAVIIKQLVGNEVIERFNDDLRAEFDRQGHLFQGDFNGYKTRRVGAVAKYSKEFPSLLAHPTILQWRIVGCASSDGNSFEYFATAPTLRVL